MKFHATENDPDYIPGTDNLFGLIDKEDDNLIKDGELILVPQPTVSPNDPLRWTAWRKYWHVSLLLLLTGLTAATSNSCGAAEDGIQEEYNIDDNVFGTGDGVLFIGIGYWTWFSAPSVNLWGSRIGYLFSMILSIIGNAWYGSSKTVSDVVWSQLFIGASEAVTEAVVQLSITQIFYQHKAQHYIGLYVLAISVGTFVGPLIGGFIADDLSWHWVGYVPVIISGFVLALLFFGLEETYFDRKHWAPLSTVTVVDGENVDPEVDVEPKKLEAENRGSDSSENSNIQPSKSLFVDREMHPMKSMASKAVHPTKSIVSIRPDIVNEIQQTIPDEPKTYWQQIRIITPAVNLKGWGFKQYCMRILLMMRVLLFPPVIYSGLQWGAQDAWLSFYIDLEDDYYYSPPYNYSDAGVGIMNVPCLIGAVIGCLYGAYFSEWFTGWRARRNGGVREAEMRLWCILPAGLISPVGMFLLGIGTERDWAWYAPYVGLGMIGFGWGCCGDLSMSYLVDCYPEMVLEGMLGVSLINNNIGMIFSFVSDRWLSAIGPQNTMISIGVLNFFFVLLTLPMIYWGKPCRRWTRDMYYSFVAKRDSLDDA